MDQFEEFVIFKSISIFAPIEKKIFLSQYEYNPVKPTYENCFTVSLFYHSLW